MNKADRKQANRKQIIFTEGAKGGGGKTTFIASLADFFLAEGIPVKLVDADIDNRSRGSLSHLFKNTPKLDIRTDHGLDRFIGMVLDDNAQTVLADLGAGNSKETWAWFDQMHDSVKEGASIFSHRGLHQRFGHRFGDPRLGQCTAGPGRLSGR
jgi:Mrp family chromosome partitioning ATPase